MKPNNNQIRYDIDVIVNKNVIINEHLIMKRKIVREFSSKRLQPILRSEILKLK